MNSNLITTKQELENFCRSVQDSEFLAIDSEFLREHTYYPELCLIQVADQNHAICIDPLLIKDLSPLKELFFSQKSTKVLHACKQDMEIFFQLWGDLPTPIYDTQVAACLLGQQDQIGYAKLVEELLGISLSKSQSRTDWSKRPLSDAQISYALADVVHLAKLYPMQRAKLEELNRLEWLHDDFRLLSEGSTYTANPQMMWKKLKNIQKLRPSQLVYAQQLAAWRESTAIKNNKPRRHIVMDEALIDIIKLMPKSVDDLANIRSISPSFKKRYATAVVAELESAASIPKEAWPIQKKSLKPTKAQTVIIDILDGILKHECHKYSINPSSVCSKKELQALLIGKTDLDILSGWRYKHAGEALVRFIAGNTNIQMINGELKFQSRTSS